MKRLLVGFLIALNVTLLLSNQVLEDRSYKIINSDNVVLSKNKENYILNLNGNVNFWYGNIEFFCDRGNIVEETETAKLFENVVVKRDSLEITSDYAYYNNLTEVVKFSGNVIAYEFDQSNNIKRQFQADSLIYKRKLEEIIASRNVVAQEFNEGIVSSSGYLEYNRFDGYGYMRFDPVIENKKDSLIISSEKMEYFADFQKVVATFNTHTQLAEADIYSNFLIYYTDQGKAVFTGQPYIETEFGTGNAHSFNLLFDENQISKVEFIDECRLDFTFDPENNFNNWLTSDRIDIYFQDKKPVSMLAESNVVYQIISEKEKENSKDYSKNDASSNKLELIFNDSNEIEEIRQLEQIQGSYVFKNAKRKKALPE